jgi:hypothetical protein
MREMVEIGPDEISREQKIRGKPKQTSQPEKFQIGEAVFAAFEKIDNEERKV